MPGWLTKILAALAIASLLGAGGAIIKHESELSAIETNIEWIKKSQERIENNLNEVLKNGTVP